MTRTHHLIPIRISTTEWWTVCNDCGMTADEVHDEEDNIIPLGNAEKRANLLGKADAVKYAT